MTNCVVDASVWVARIISTDIFHSLVVEWMDARRNSGNEFLAPSLLLSEVAGVVSRRTQSPDLAASVVEQLQKLPELKLVEMEAKLTQQAAALAARLGLRGADAFYTAAANYLHVPLVTLDDDQALRSSYLVEVIRLSGK
jgi:predicted nucleic acid-binding protein